MAKSHVTTAAGIYSQVAGMLAGLAFTALVAFLGRHAQADDDSAAVTLMLTFVSLVVVAVLYAVLAGGPDESGPAYLGVMIYGGSFALAILSMFHSIGLLAARTAGLVWTLRAARVWTSAVGPAVAMLLVSSAALDIYYFNCGVPSGDLDGGLTYVGCEPATSQLAPTKPFGLGLALAIGVLALSSIVLLRRTRYSHGRGWLAAPAMVATAFAIMASGAAVWLLMTPSDFAPGEHLQIAVISVVGLATLTFGVLSASAHPLVGVQNESRDHDVART
jgi:hypothetical protein